MKKNIKVIVATHKKYEMPKDDCYLPIHVGKKGKDSIGFQGDDEGDNISHKNPYYCELTGLYYGWKNVACDYMGLAHYRRHFRGARKDKTNKFNMVLSGEEMSKIFDKVDVILPKKQNYVIENLYSHYKHTLFIEPLDETEKIIEEKYPEYAEEFRKLKTRKSAHMFNMFIMKKEIADEYCQWMFDVLEQLESRVDVSKYNGFHARFYGRISELMMDVFINTKKLSYKEVPMIYMEDINWLNKVMSFLGAKFFGKKYGQSF